MRCFLPPAAWDAAEPILPPGEAHYAAQVLRAGPGDPIEVFDGEGRIASAVLTRCGRREAAVSLGRIRRVDPPRPAVHLLQALPKAQKMEWIIQKGAELGMARLTPLATRHAVVQLDAGRAGKRLARWRDIALNAVRQCGRAWLPRIAPVQHPADALSAAVRPEILLLADLRAGARNLRETLAEARRADPASIGILIGPEGDFAAEELATFDEAGALAVSLGSTVLRTETAALYALGVLRYEFG